MFMPSNHATLTREVSTRVKLWKRVWKLRQQNGKKVNENKTKQNNVRLKPDL